MGKKEWFGSRVTFAIREDGSVIFQQLDDIRSCRDWLIEDYGCSDFGVNQVPRGQILKNEISFFCGEEYDSIDEDLLSTALLKVIKKHDEVFGKFSVVVANGKIPSDNYVNWRNRCTLGVWSTQEEPAFM